MDSLAVIKEGISEEEINDYLREIAVEAISRNKFLSNILDGFGKVELEGKRVCDVVMSPKFFSDLRIFGRDVIDPITEQKNIIRGHVVSLWGANVWLDKSLEEHDVRFYSDEDSLLQQDFPKIIEFKNELGLE